MQIHETNLSDIVTPEALRPMLDAVQARLRATINAANLLLINGYQIIHLAPSALCAKPVIIVASEPRLWQMVKDNKAVYYRSGTDDSGHYRVGQWQFEGALVKWIERGN